MPVNPSSDAAINAERRTQKGTAPAGNSMTGTLHITLHTKQDSTSTSALWASGAHACSDLIQSRG